MISEIKYMKKKETEKKTGFVPTMGYLHKGHESLLLKAREENDIVVLSIYVNPTQFGKNEDLDKYPRDMERDVEMAKRAGVDYIFYPDDAMMYPEGYKTIVQVGGISEIMCGKQRPTHFMGVTTVVAKLFNIIVPDNAYFGQKDMQQAAIIKQMTNDLNIDVKINICPIIREKDGLAMSSRNKYLSETERKNAPLFYKALQYGKEQIYKWRKEEKFLIDIEEEMKKMLEDSGLFSVDYIEIRDKDTLKLIDEGDRSNQGILIAGAVRLGSTRLIDNIII
jgi:pantoate--beta-alanine ligase